MSNAEGYTHYTSYHSAQHGDYTSLGNMHTVATPHLHAHNTVIMSKDGLVTVSIVEAPHTNVLVCRAGGQQCIVLSGAM